MEITKVVKPFIRRGWPNTFGNIVYLHFTFIHVYIWLYIFLISQLKNCNLNQLDLLLTQNVHSQKKVQKLSVAQYLFIFIFLQICTIKVIMSSF